MASVLITGAAGFIGSYLARTLLDRGERVTCLVRQPSRAAPLETLGARLVVGDITKPDTLRPALTGISVVYHLAACVHALSLQGFHEVNALGVQNLLEAAARQREPPVVVFVSSLAAVGPAPRGRLRVETDPICPVSLYGRSKRAGELVAEQYADRLPITVVRPAIVFGEGDRQALPLFSVPYRTRLHLVPDYYPHRFSMIHVEDLAEILFRAAERGKRLAPGGAPPEASPVPGYYFACGNEHPTYYELGHLIGRALGVRVLSIPWALVAVWITALGQETFGRLLGQRIRVGFDKAREASAGAWNCQAQPTLEDLDYRLPFPLAQRLHQTAQWYRQAGWL